MADKTHKENNSPEEEMYVELELDEGTVKCSIVTIFECNEKDYLTKMVKMKTAKYGYMVTKKMKMTQMLSLNLFILTMMMSMKQLLMHLMNFLIARNSMNLLMENSSSHLRYNNYARYTN